VQGRGGRKDELVFPLAVGAAFGSGGGHVDLRRGEKDTEGSERWFLNSDVSLFNEGVSAVGGCRGDEQRSTRERSKRRGNPP